MGEIPFIPIIFLLWGEGGKMCLPVVDKMSTVPPGAVMAACFSLSGPNILPDIENMGRDPLPLGTSTSTSVPITRDVVGRVVELPEQPRRRGRRGRGPCAHAQRGRRPAVHEDHVGAGNVQRHPRRQHDAGLRLKEREIIYAWGGVVQYYFYFRKSIIVMFECCVKQGIQVLFSMNKLY